MRLATLQHPAGPVAAAAVEGGYVRLSGATGHRTVLDLIAAGPVAWSEAADRLKVASRDADLDGLALLAPLPNPPRNVFCIGLNYRAHAEEGGGDRLAATAAAPLIFTKPWTSLIGDLGVVTIDPAVTAKADWEAELAIVIGAGGSDIAPERALGHVFGATLANDLSARDLQLASGDRSQWFKGKALDGFCPLGPEIVTLDELPPLDQLHLQLDLNGTQMQDLYTVDMIHPIEAIIAYLSRGMALLPGDVILTGTGAGVGHYQNPPRYLTPGDLVTVSAAGLGQLRTSFAAPSKR